jgi:hypothetical protein
VSVRVETERLREEAVRFGGAPFLLTVSDDGAPHAVSVTVAWDDEEVVAVVGSRTAANAAARPAVTLLWPPVDDAGFSLIVDGTADVRGDRVVIHPTRAVLHRQRPDGAGSDCVRLDDA